MAMISGTSSEKFCEDSEEPEGFALLYSSWKADLWSQDLTFEVPKILDLSGPMVQEVDNH